MNNTWIRSQLFLPCRFAGMDYFRSQQLRNYRQNYSLFGEIGGIDYTALVPLMVTRIVDFDTDGSLILDLCNN